MSSNKAPGQVYKIICGEMHGNAFLVADDRLLTCRHVVEHHKGNEIKLKVSADVDAEEIVCTLIATDSDDFSASSLALLQPANPLPKWEKTAYFKGTLLENFSLKVYGYLAEEDLSRNTVAIKSIHSVLDSEKANSENGEMITHQFTTEPAAPTLKGLSGSPIFLSDALCGILNAQKAIEGKTIFAYGLCGADFFDKLDKCLFPPPPEGPPQKEPTFEEKLAAACDDCLDGFGDLFSYTRESNDPSWTPPKVLRSFAMHLLETLTEIDDDAVIKRLKLAASELQTLYPSPKPFMDVYAAALGSAFSWVYYSDQSDLWDGMIRMLRLAHLAVADGFIKPNKTFPEQELLLGLCYAKNEKYPEARTHLEKASTLVHQASPAKPNCHADTYLLLALLPSGTDQQIEMSQIGQLLYQAAQHPGNCGFTPCKSEAYRRLAAYTANINRFYDAWSYIDNAYALDCTNHGYDICLDHDDTCLRFVCERAFQLYNENQSEWESFFAKASGSLEKYKRGKDVLQKIELDAKQFFDLIADVSNAIRTKKELDPKTLLIEENHENASLTNRGYLAQLLDDCTQSRRFLVKRTKAHCDNPGVFLEYCNHFHQFFQSNPPEGYQVKLLNGGTEIISPREILYTYLYQKNGCDPIPVWQQFVLSD